MRISDWSSDVCSSDLHLVANAFNDLVQFIDALANQAAGFVSRALADEVAVILESVTGKAEIAVDLVKFQVCLDDRAGAVDPAISALQCISQLGVCKAATKEINRSEEHTTELQSLMRISYAELCLTNKIQIT